MQETIMLFYSDHCFACRQLLQELDRQNVGNKILRTSVDLLRAKGQRIPPQIHSVPALYILPSKTLHFGKQVFDYLLNLHTGKIRELNKVGRGMGPEGATTTTTATVPAPPTDEIQPYVLGGAQLSDNFVYLSGTEGFLDHGNDHQVSYAFAALDGSNPISGPHEILTSQTMEPLQADTSKPKKLDVDMEAIMTARRSEEQNFLGLSAVPKTLPPELMSQKA